MLGAARCAGGCVCAGNTAAAVRSPTGIIAVDTTSTAITTTRTSACHRARVSAGRASKVENRKKDITQYAVVAFSAWLISRDAIGSNSTKFTPRDAAIPNGYPTTHRATAAVIDRSRTS